MNELTNILKEPFSSTPITPAPHPLTRAAVWLAIGFLIAR